MAQQIAFTNKTDSVVLGNPDNEKARAADFNEIKAVVNANATELDAVGTTQSAASPIGTVQGVAGNIHKEIDTATFMYQMWMHIGVIQNDTDWIKLPTKPGEVLGGSNVQTTTTIAAINTPTPVAIALTLESNFNFTQPGNGILQYNGPRTDSESIKIDASLAAMRGGGGGVETFKFQLRRNRGGFVDIGFGSTTGISGTDILSVFTTALLTGVQPGDQFQLWVENQTSTNDLVTESIELAIF